MRADGSVSEYFCDSAAAVCAIEVVQARHGGDVELARKHTLDDTGAEYGRRDWGRGPAFGSGLAAYPEAFARGAKYSCPRDRPRGAPGERGCRISRYGSR